MASPLEVHKRYRTIGEAILRMNQAVASDLLQGREKDPVGPLNRWYNIPDLGMIQGHFRVAQFVRKRDGLLSTDYDKWEQIGNYRFVIEKLARLMQLQQFQIVWDEQDQKHYSDWVVIRAFTPQMERVR